VDWSANQLASWQGDDILGQGNGNRSCADCDNNGTKEAYRCLISIMQKQNPNPNEDPCIANSTYWVHDPTYDPCCGGSGSAATTTTTTAAATTTTTSAPSGGTTTTTACGTHGCGGGPAYGVNGQPYNQTFSAWTGNTGAEGWKHETMYQYTSSVWATCDGVIKCFLCVDGCSDHSIDCLGPPGAGLANDGSGKGPCDYWGWAECDGSGTSFGGVPNCCADTAGGGGGTTTTTTAATTTTTTAGGGCNCPVGEGLGTSAGDCCYCCDWQNLGFSSFGCCANWAESNDHGSWVGGDPSCAHLMVDEANCL
jgi:hypothetical protein